MNNSKNNLVKLLEVVQKDTGINNAVDAIEQLSLLLMLEYCYQISDLGSLGDIIQCHDSLFLDNADENDFDLLKYVSKSQFHRKGTNRKVSEKLWDKIEEIVKSIPLKIKSKNILRHLSINLCHIDFFDRKIAEDYDELIIRMVNNSVSSGAYYSPKSIVSAIVGVVKPNSENSIYDPALGTGRFIIEVENLYSEYKHRDKFLNVYGKDISPFANLIGTLNLLLNGVDISNIELGDSLLEKDNKLYDIILSAIPFGKTADIGRYERFYHGISSNLETMFLKHAMEKLAKGGKAAVIVPDGILFQRNKELIQLRRELLSSYNLHSILSLPNGALSPYSGVKVSVLFFDRKEPGEDIWFYELESGKSFSKKKPIKDSDLLEFVEIFSQRIETVNSCLVSVSDILKREDLSLSIELPNNEKLDFQSQIEVDDIKKKMRDIDLLFSDFMGVLEDKKKTEFIEKVTIGELFKTRAGKLLKRSEIRENGEIPVYGANGIIGYYDEPNLTGENILIGRVGAHCGNVHFTKGPIWLTHNSFSVQILSKKEIYLPYLAYVLRSLNLNSTARGAAQPSISYSNIKDIEVNLPSYQQQVELSQWFDEIQKLNDELRKEAAQQIERLTLLAKNSIVSNCVLFK